MSGHSKWSTIKHKKAALDAKKGKVFTKIIKELMVAAKNGGSDPNTNPRLRQAVSTAKAANMPSDTMLRAIQKGSGELEGVTYEELVYEGFGPGGVAIIIDVLTDNKNRTVAEIRHLMVKYDGNLGENGSVSWMFDKLGQIVLEKESHNEDDLFNFALEAGADDFLVTKNFYLIFSKPTLTVDIADLLEDKGYKIISSSIEMISKNKVSVDDKEAIKVLSLIDSLENHDDVQNIFSNLKSVESE